jgi:cysteine desulfurase/selenocysteine lyase
MVRPEPIDADRIRKDFPILKRQVAPGKPLIYFDNAATNQKPQCVIDVLDEFYSEHNANIHRGIHMLSEEATERYERARETIARFINDDSPTEIVFVRGTTEAINLVAYAHVLKKLGKGDGILTTIMEHHSNIVPWQMMRDIKGISLDFVDITDDGHLKMEELKRKTTKRTKLVAAAHASNVLGTINDARAIADIAHDRGALCLIDGAQSVPHMSVDVRKMGCDFLAFSGHKMCGPTGIGVLYAKKEMLESMDPFMGGGDMIREVHVSGAKWNTVPYKFEAGTPNIAGTIGLGAACEYLSKIGMDRVREHEKGMVSYVLKETGDLDIIDIYGPKGPEKRGGVFTYNVHGVNSHDLASLLDTEGIAIRSGHLCAQPLMERLGQTSMARASFYIYNTKSEVDILISALKRVHKLFAKARGR